MQSQYHLHAIQWKSINSNTIQLIKISLFSEFNIFAKYLEIKGAKFLVHDGYRFSKNGENDLTNSVYWRCRGYSKYKCLARGITRVLDGYDMVKMKGTHIHPRTKMLKVLNKVKLATKHTPSPAPLLKLIKISDSMQSHSSQFNDKQFSL